MTRVFLSGSRRISRLNEAVRERLRNMIENELIVLIGDANGADKAMQSFFRDQNYQNVKVYCSGGKCRNNIGGWPTEPVDVDASLKGRAFYTVKDKAMARAADIGFVLWDGKSKGSLANAIELLDAGKKVVLFHSADQAFYNFKEKSQLSGLLPPESKFDTVAQAGHRSSKLGTITASAQSSLPL